MKKVVYFILFLMILVSCVKEETGEVSDSNTTVCLVTGKDHSGCCSHHGGISSCNSNGEFYTVDGKLVCADNTISPTCTMH